MPLVTPLWSVSLRSGDWHVEGCTDVCWVVQIRLEKLSRQTGCNIVAKSELQNPGGSVKDRAALGVIRDAEKGGL